MLEGDPAQFLRKEILRVVRTCEENAKNYLKLLKTRRMFRNHQGTFEEYSKTILKLSLWCTLLHTSFTCILLKMPAPRLRFYFSTRKRLEKAGHERR